MVPLERETGESAVVTTSTGEIQEYTLYGTALVALPTGEAELNLYAHPEDKAPVQLFVPFRDATSGPETYGAGRYLEAGVQGNEVILAQELLERASANPEPAVHAICGSRVILEDGRGAQFSVRLVPSPELPLWHDGRCPHRSAWHCTTGKWVRSSMFSGKARCCITASWR